MSAFFLSSLATNAQVIKVKETADSLFQVGDYGMALHEYKRYLHYSGKENRDKLYFSMGNCALEIQNPSEAQFYFQKVQFQKNVSPTLRDSAQFRAAFSAYLQSNYHEAQVLLNLLRKNTESVSILQECYFLSALSYNSEGEFPSGKAELELAFQNDTTNIERVDSLYQEALDFKAKKPNRAMFLSVIIPGAGQIYAGKPLDGFISLGLTAGVAALGVYAILQRRFLFGFLSTLTLFQRFYEGGARYSSALALQWNEDKRTAHTKRINLFILAHWMK